MKIDFLEKSVSSKAMRAGNPKNGNPTRYSEKTADSIDTPISEECARILTEGSIVIHGKILAATFITGHCFVCPQGGNGTLSLTWNSKSVFWKEGKETIAARLERGDKVTVVCDLLSNQLTIRSLVVHRHR